nr:hypothetical protein [Tanacetum cinerariifolium]
MSHVLGSLVAADILASGGLRSAFSIASLSVFSPAVATANGSFPTALARDLEAKFAQDDQIIREQAERDSKIVRIHAERELVMMIAKLDKSNEMITKYLSEYEQAKLESERLKRPGIQMDKERSKKLKTTEASGTKPTQENQSKEPKELSEEEIKKMIELEIHTLSILKMKAAYYPDVGLEQMVPDQMWTDEECKYDITAIDDTLLQIDEALDYRVKEFKTLVSILTELYTFLLEPTSNKLLIANELMDAFGKPFE